MIDLPDLDRWLPDPQIRTHYRRTADVDARTLWHAAETIRVGDAPRLGRVLRWRIPGTPVDLPYREVFRRYPFAVLEEGEGWSVSGLCGRPWSLRRDYPELAGPDDFGDWDEPGTVRILFAHWAVEDGEVGAEIVSESRVEPIDRGARWRMRALWSALGRFEGLIGREALDAAVKAASSNGA
jgi:hypothetical protein